jgi:hypothetical protein
MFWWLNIVIIFWSSGSNSNSNLTSLWWKDIRALDVGIASQNWFERVVIRRLGNGALTRFWIDKWIWDMSLCIKFPRLFSLALHKSAYISEMLVAMEGESRSCNFHWRRPLLQWEEDNVTQLVESLVSMRLSNEINKWWWFLEPEGSFSVKSAFDSISREIVEGPNLNNWELKIFNNIWKSPAPSKVVSFSWQLLYNRIPTKDNLLLRGAIQHGSGGNCVWCGVLTESANHLFLHCKMAMKAWYKIFKWLGVVIVMTSNLFNLFDYFCGVAQSMKSRKGFMLVWHMAIWSARNNKIFNNVSRSLW